MPTTTRASRSLHPYHPIVYVRGFAATQAEIEDAVADPYMGFNIGSTKSRTVWTGEVKRFYFESPLVRLMADHGYDDVFVEGDDLLQAERSDAHLPYRSIIIYRYYDEASRDFGTGDTPPIEHFARGLSALILRLRARICSNPKNHVTEEDFKVYLVAHSMGGLVCRAFLQNAALGDADARAAVDKLFTYATPHNGIDLRIVRNVPGWLSFGDVNNFSRGRMASYLALSTDDDVSRVAGFPAERIFNLVGTNPRDYTAAGGLSSWAVGEASDGLVRIDNAVTHAVLDDGTRVTSPRAFVHRSHSGHYGIVNSEEGYQNLTRFLFGQVRMDGFLDLDEITLPVEVERAVARGKQLHASYQFEIAVSVRGCQWQMTRRDARENSAIFRTWKALFPSGGGAPDRTQSPHLFSAFLDPTKSVRASKSVSLAFDLKVLVPDYEVDGLLFIKRHYEGGHLYRKMVLIEAVPDDTALGGWLIKYGFQDEGPGQVTQQATTRPIGDGGAPTTTTSPTAEGLTFDIPVEQATRPGLKGRLRIEVRPWV